MQQPPAKAHGERQSVADRPINWAEMEEPEARLRDYGPEDYVVLVFFWALAIVVFLQFFTRYVLNDSYAWTEEVARQLLIIVCFVGGAMAMRKNSHIFVEFFYRYLSPTAGRALSTAVDIVRIALFAWITWVTWKITLVMHSQSMAVYDAPQSLLYGMVLFGFVMMTLRSVQVAVRHWRQGESELSRVSRPRDGA